MPFAGAMQSLLVCLFTLECERYRLLQFFELLRQRQISPCCSTRPCHDAVYREIGGGFDHDLSKIRSLTRWGGTR